MHGSLGHFKATLQRRKERSESKNRGNFSRKNSYTSEGKIADEVNRPKMSETEFTEFKLKLKAARKKQNSKELVILITVFGTLITLLIWVFN